MKGNNELKALRAELKRVKKIAFDRLERIVDLTTEVAVLEDKLEDTRSDLRDMHEANYQNRKFRTTNMK
jgi:predicted  nucleic acid-binding Zn-ribbon protein